MGAIGCRGGAAPVRGRRVSPRVEGPGDEPPAVEAAHKGAHERLKMEQEVAGITHLLAGACDVFAVIESRYCEPIDWVTT